MRQREFVEWWFALTMCVVCEHIVFGLYMGTWMEIFESQTQPQKCRDKFGPIVANLW